MPFPSILSLLDDANRANTGPPPSGSWSTPSGAAGISVSGNQFAGSGAGNVAIYTGSYGPDCEARFKIATLAGNGNGISVVCCGQQVSSLATIDGYTVVHTQAAGTDTVNIQKMTDGSVVTLGASINQEVAAGDSIGIQRRGTGVEGFYESGAGAWSSLGTRTDSTYGAGAIGMVMINTTGRLDDFSGGTYAALSIPVAMAQYRQRGN